LPNLARRLSGDTIGLNNVIRLDSNAIRLDDIIRLGDVIRLNNVIRLGNVIRLDGNIIRLNNIIRLVYNKT